MFPNKLAVRVPNKILWNHHICSFVSVLIVLVTLFIEYFNLLELEQFALCHPFHHVKLLKLLF